MKRAPPAAPRPDTPAAGDAFVEAWRGVPFRWDGRDREGIDCWGLVVRFHETVKGETLPDWSRRGQARNWIAATMRNQERDHWRELNDLVDGCIVKAIGHVGIYWRGGVLHAAEKRGVVYDRLADFQAMHPGAQFGEYVP